MNTTQRTPVEPLTPQRLHGTVAATVTPLDADGRDVDSDGVESVTSFLVEAGVDGILTLGTTGEGMLFNATERRQITRLFVAAARGRVPVAAHCGAQNTGDTVRLAAAAAEDGAAAVAVIGPPYFALDGDSLFLHFLAAAKACAPCPFYLYEFAARTGYSIPLTVIERLRESADNLVGIKVSDTPWDAFSAYLLDGLDIMVGPESLIATGMAAGARGAVSGLAAAFPELVTAAVTQPGLASTERAGKARAILQQFPFHAALKVALRARGVDLGVEVRGPLRGLNHEEYLRLEQELVAILRDFPPVGARGAAEPV